MLFRFLGLDLEIVLLEEGFNPEDDFKLAVDLSGVFAFSSVFEVKLEKGVLPSSLSFSIRLSLICFNGLLAFSPVDEGFFLKPVWLSGVFFV